MLEPQAPTGGTTVYVHKRCWRPGAPQSEVHRSSTHLLAPEARPKVCVAVQALVQPVIWWGLGRALALGRDPLRCLGDCCLMHSLLPQRPAVKKKTKGELAGHLAGRQGAAGSQQRQLLWQPITSTHKDVSSDEQRPRCKASSRTWHPCRAASLSPAQPWHPCRCAAAAHCCSQS